MTEGQQDPRGETSQLVISNGPSKELKRTSIANIPAHNKALGSVFILDNVLLPLLRYDISSKKVRESNLRSSLHLTYAKKFSSRVCRFVEQQEKGVQLNIPGNIEELCSEETSEIEKGQVNMKSIERLVSEWNMILTRSIKCELQHKPKNNLPMGEVDFWRRRHVVLSDIMEQIKHPRVQRILELIKTSGSALVIKIHENISDLTKLAVEAADNAKFLSTLERHLRTISDGSLSSTITALPSLVDGMRMVWTVSRHYNRDERMLPLMERVRFHVACRVKEKVKPSDLLVSNDLDLVKEKVQQSKILLESWRRSYMSTKELMEEMGNSQRRWEFDRILLFEQTDYMASTCGDLLTIIDSVNDFKSFFSPDLLAITGEKDDVNQIVSCMDGMTNAIVTCNFDVFDISNKTKWQAAMQDFHNGVASIEISARAFIERAFQQLRSSKVAFEFLVNLASVKSRTGIHRLVEERFKDVLDRYESELEEAKSLYTKYKEHPPLCRRYQKTPGIVACVHDIYLRAKSTVVLFQKHGDILTTPRGERVKRKYLSFAKEVDLFKEKTFIEWTVRVKNDAQDGLRRPILKRNDDSIIETNFSNQLRITIAEGMQFNSLGYTISESLVHLVLQQKIYDEYTIELEKLSHSYNGIFRILCPLEHIILSQHIERMNIAMQPGFTTINWSSQCISAYVQKANTAIDVFQAILCEIKKHSSSLDCIVKSIGKSSLVGIKSVSEGTLTRATLDALDNEILTNGVFIESEHKTMGSLVRKVEMIIKADGPLTLAPSYYQYWEKRLYNAFVELTTRSLLTLFYFRGIKTYQDASLLLKRGLKTILHSLNQHNRWKANSCEEAILSRDDGNEDRFTFKDDIERHPSLRVLLRVIKSHIVIVGN